MGGEPLLHPEFDKLCAYLHSVVPRERAGLWTALPEGMEEYGPIIAETFGNIFINDHTLNNVLHQPLLVSAKSLDIEPANQWYYIDKCWVQNSWSASVNPLGAFFCEVAAAIALTLGYKNIAWPVESLWWTRNPIDYYEQATKCCDICGAAFPLQKRNSNDFIDDLSDDNVKRLRKVKSPKVEAGLFRLYEEGLCIDTRPIATYKDFDYRSAVAKKYNLFLTLNKKDFHEPHYLKES